MDTHWPYHGNQFMMYESQTIVLYTLNLHSTIGQLYFNKTEREQFLNKNAAPNTPLILPESPSNS